jgi:hypothetical protein
MRGLAGWPGERPPRKTLKRAAQSILFRVRWWRIWLPRALRRVIDNVLPRQL